MYFFTRNCTIETVLTGSLKVGNATTNYHIFSGNNKKEVLIDGDLIKNGSTYYELKDGEIYRYTKGMNGKWYRELYVNDVSIISDLESGDKLLDPKNYERAKGHIFVWELKDDVDVKFNNLSNIRVERSGGKIAIVGDYSYQGQLLEISIRFTKFGRTKITLPEGIKNLT